MDANAGNHSGLWKALMVGGFLGVATGFLFAPKSGRELRSDIEGKTDRVLEETKRLYSDGRTKFSNTFAFITRRREKASSSHIESPEEIVADA
jgi:gas vesicle protein